MSKLLQFDCGCRIWCQIGSLTEFLHICDKHLSEIKEQFMELDVIKDDKK